MATSVAVDRELEAAVGKFDKEIARVEVDLRDWRAQSQDANDSLQLLEEQYADACTKLAQKQGGAEEPSKIQARTQVLRDRLVGIKNVIAERESTLNALRAEIATLHAEQSQRAQARNIAEERQTVETLVADAEQALNDLNNAATRFANGLRAIRERQYVSEGTRHFGFDKAFALQRIAAGQRP